METSFASAHLIAQVFDNQPDTVIWYKPVFDGAGTGKMVDMSIEYANQSAARILGVPRSAVIGQRLRSTELMDTATVALEFDQCQQVWQSGKPLEHSYYNMAFDRYFNVQRSKVEGGVLCVTRDRTTEVATELQLKKQQKKYEKVIENVTDGVMFLEPVRDTGGTITDFQLVYCNRYAIEVGTLPDIYEGKTLLQVFPNMKYEELALHRQVAATGEPVRYETHFQTPDGQAYGWFIVSLSKADDVVVSRFTDISNRKFMEENTRRQAEKLDQILNASLNAIFTCEAVRDESGKITDLRYTQVNKMYEQLIGKTAEDVLGRTMLELFPTAKTTGAFDRHCQVIETGQPARFDLRYEGEGLDAWYDISSVKVDDNSVVVTFADVMEEKKAFLEVERQKMLLDNILQFSPSGITIIKAVRDKQGNVVDVRHILVNDQAEKFIGFPKDMLLTRSNTEMDPGFAKSRLLQELVSTLKTGRTTFSSYQMPGGQWIEGAASKMDDDHLVCVISDVTSSKEAQVQMQGLLDELKRSNKSLEEFAYSASHDLQEPLRKIRFFTERLKKGLATATPEENLAHLNRIEASTVRMTGLITDLLTYSQVSVKPNSMEQVDLNETVQMVLQDLDGYITETGVGIQVGHLPFVRGDDHQLRQLFQNLLSNAIKYRKANVIAQIEVRHHIISANDPEWKGFSGRLHGAFHLIEVRDNGIGFEQEDADRIFNVFTRLHGNSEYTGSGVGLAIVKRVVSNHKGYVSAEAKPGVGAVFKVLLPI